jgi:hypothetical protein
MAERHMKLSDVEAQKVYPFRGPASTFQAAYPTVKSIRVEVRPVGEGFEPFRNMTEWLDVYTESTIPARIDCRNPRCFGGGVELEYLIRWAVVGEADRVRGRYPLPGLRGFSQRTPERRAMRYVLQGESQCCLQGRTCVN